MNSRGNTSKLFFMVVFIPFVVACGDNERDMEFPGDEWQRASPSSQGIDESKMLQALEYLSSKCFEDGIEEVLIVRDGRVIFEGDSIRKKHNIWSCTKSFTSTVLGLLIEESKCRLEDQVYRYEPIMEERYEDVTLRHFATMTSGYNARGGNRWEENSEDWSWTPYLPDEPLFSPGSKFAYWDEAMMMNSRILTRITGVTLKDYFDEKVANKIGFNDWEWLVEGAVDGIPINNGCTNIILDATQLARFGHLFLNRGQWEGEQLVPENWVWAATSVQVPVTTPVAGTDRNEIRGSGSYGFNWWVNGGLSALPEAPSGTYYASGFNHNVCFVIPDWHMVIVRMGTDGNPPEGKHIIWNEFLRLMAEAILQ